MLVTIDVINVVEIMPTPEHKQYFYDHRFRVISCGDTEVEAVENCFAILTGMSFDGLVGRIAKYKGQYYKMLGTDVIPVQKGTFDPVPTGNVGERVTYTYDERRRRAYREE